MVAWIWRCGVALFAALAIGVIVSVVVAHVWASKKTPGGLSHNSMHTRGSGMFTYSQSHRGALDIYQIEAPLPARMSLDLRDMSRVEFEEILAADQASIRAGPGQQDVDLPPPRDWQGWVVDPGVPVKEFSVAVVGWPWRCMYVTGVNAGSPVTVFKVKANAMDGVLPRWKLPDYRVLWPGMLKNAATSGSPMLALFAVRAAARPW
ncbi:MAG: hypothetical protein AABZ53_07955 [Planctomycetota bacterium]